MNEELLKIRESNGYDDKKDNRCTRVSEKVLLDNIHDLNTNARMLYCNDFPKEYSENELINKLIENIYIILNMFSEMNVYPGYFFRKVFEINSKYYERKKDYDSSEDTVRVKSGMRGDYRFFYQTHLSAWVSGEIRNGLNNGYHHVQSYPQTNISDAFLEVLALFQKYDLPYSVTDTGSYKKIFGDIAVNLNNITDALLNSDSDFEDIEYMCRMLYEYISLFVVIGVNPKKYLDDYIEEKCKKKSK